MEVKQKPILVSFAFAVILAGIAWAMVWGFAITHPESGIERRFAPPVMIVTFLVVIAYRFIRPHLK